MVKDNLLKEPCYIALVQFGTMTEQACSSARELFEELCREEKDVLKKHKDSFKSLVKQKMIRFPSTVSFGEFISEMRKHDTFPASDEYI